MEQSSGCFQGFGPEHPGAWGMPFADISSIREEQGLCVFVLFVFREWGEVNTI